MVNTKKNSKKGSTLVEVIVSMSLAVLVSFLAFTICNAVITNTNKVTVKNFFITQSQSYVKAYYLGEHSYSVAIKLLTNKDANWGEDLCVFYSNELSVCEEENASYYVNLTFSGGFGVECFNISNKIVFKVEV